MDLSDQSLRLVELNKVSRSWGQLADQGFTLDFDARCGMNF